jgi:hypothetical protein
MIVCVFEHVQYRFVLNDRLARGYPSHKQRNVIVQPEEHRDVVELAVGAVQRRHPQLLLQAR